MGRGLSGLVSGCPGCEHRRYRHRLGSPCSAWQGLERLSLVSNSLPPPTATATATALLLPCHHLPTVSTSSSS